MPQRSSRGKATAAGSKRANRRTKTTQNEDNVHEESEICDVCCSAIIDDKEDALLCEGSCQKWFHRYCAGVSSTCFRLLSNSSTPFVCWLCSQELHRTIVSQLQAEIAALRVEVVELRSDIKKTNRPQWSKVVAQNAGPMRRKTDKEEHSRSSSTQPTQSRSVRPASSGPRQRIARRRENSEKVKLEGKRKIWGTRHSTSAVAVSNAIKRITDVEVAVKRKYKTSAAGRTNSARASRWWFVVSGDEDLLKQLEEKWTTVKLQTNWSLEPVLCFNESREPAQEASNEPSTPTTSQPTTSPQDPLPNSLPQSSPETENVASAPSQD